MALPWFVDAAFLPFADAVGAAVPPAGVAALCLAWQALSAPLLVTDSPAVWLAARLFSLGPALAVCFAGRLLGFATAFACGRALLHRRGRVARWRRRAPRLEATLLVAEELGGPRCCALLRVSVSDNPSSYALAALPPRLLSWRAHLAASALPVAPFVAASVLVAREIETYASVLGWGRAADGGTTASPSAARRWQLGLSVAGAVGLAVWGGWWGRRRWRAALVRARARSPPRSRSPSPSGKPRGGAEEGGPDDGAADGPR